MRTIKSIIFCISVMLFSNFAHAQYQNEKIKPGMVAPELAFTNPEGKEIKLSEINKGRYVLVDFWASWCGPCRRANPSLVAFYKKYSNMNFKDAKKGFTIYSVSLDKNKDSWVKAIQSDSLYWENHVSDLGYWQSAAAAAYGVQFIPQSFLIGPDGKVIGTYMVAEQAEADVQKYVKKKKKFLFF